MLEKIDHRPVRLIGVSIYNLAGEEWRQLKFDDLFEKNVQSDKIEQKKLLDHLQNRYKLDFAGNLEKIYHGETLNKTVAYMRKHRNSG